jgi:hypothetical protein
MDSYNPMYPLAVATEDRWALRRVMYVRTSGGPGDCVT